MSRQFLLPFVSLLSSLLLLTACGPGKDKARFEGNLQNITEAEFYAYSDDGLSGGVDTIKITDGKFTYERTLTEPLLLTLLYPNFTQTYVVLEPGKTVKMKGNAAKIGEAGISGTDDNDLLTEFRQAHVATNPANLRLAAADFVRSHSSTLAAVAVYKKYFLQSETPDVRQALSLLKELQKAQPKSNVVRALSVQFQPRLQTGVGQTLPDFTATTLSGKTVRTSDYRGKRLLIAFCASWQYTSLSMLRSARNLLKETGMPPCECLVVSLDADQGAWKRAMKSDSIVFPTLCDGKVFDTPLAKTFGVKYVPSFILTDTQGRIVARDVTDMNVLRTKLRQ